MKRIITFFSAIGFSVLFIHIVNGQQVITSTGGTTQNGNGTLSYSLGELVTETHVTGKIAVTQGFHQTEITVIPVNEIPELEYSMVVFPNPAHDYVVVKIENGDPQNISYFIYAMNGTTIQNGSITGSHTELNFSSFAEGTYLLELCQDGEKIKTVQIVKIVR